jgi:uncharacterized membrane protein YecN with MAPEG domain
MAGHITAVYAGLLALLFLWLSARVSMARARSRIVIGLGDDPHLLRLSRAQANCAEYAPIGLLLILLLELGGAAAWLLHGLGAVLLAGRALHGYGIALDPEPLILRQLGMVGTYGVIGVAGVLLVVWGVF